MSAERFWKIALSTERLQQNGSERWAPIISDYFPIDGMDLTLDQKPCSKTLSITKEEVSRGSEWVRTIVFAAYLYVQIKVVVNTITVLGVGSTVKLTITSFVDLAGSTMVYTILKSFTFRVVSTQLLTFVDCCTSVHSFTSISFDVMAAHASRWKVSPAHWNTHMRHA